MSERHYVRNHVEYVNERLTDLRVVQDHLTKTQHLKAILDQDWIESVADSIRRIKPDLRCTDSAFFLFRILHDEVSRCNLIERLDHAIGEIENLANRTARRRSFLESRSKLKSSQVNQIQGAIFEFLTLNLFLLLTSRNGLEIDVYFPLPNGRNIEGRVLCRSRWCNFEAKAFGFSEHDAGMRSDASPVGWHSVYSMTRQIHDALRDKASQLSGTKAPEPNIVCLALGYNADSHSGPWGIEEFFRTSDGQHLSAVLLFGSFLCRQHPKLIRNDMSLRPLTAAEEKILADFPAD